MPGSVSLLVTVSLVKVLPTWNEILLSVSTHLVLAVAGFRCGIESDQQVSSGHVLEGCGRQHARRAIVHFLVIRSSYPDITIDFLVEMERFLRFCFFLSFFLSFFPSFLPSFLFFLFFSP